MLTICKNVLFLSFFWIITANNFPGRTDNVCSFFVQVTLSYEEIVTPFILELSIKHTNANIFAISGIWNLQRLHGVVWCQNKHCRPSKKPDTARGLPLVTFPAAKRRSILIYTYIRVLHAWEQNCWTDAYINNRPEILWPVFHKPHREWKIHGLNNGSGGGVYIDWPSNWRNIEGKKMLWRFKCYHFADMHTSLE